MIIRVKQVALSSVSCQHPIHWGPGCNKRVEQGGIDLGWQYELEHWPSALMTTGSQSLRLHHRFCWVSKLANGRLRDSPFYITYISRCPIINPFKYMFICRLFYSSRGQWSTQLIIVYGPFCNGLRWLYRRQHLAAKEIPQGTERWQPLDYKSLRSRNKRFLVDWWPWRVIFHICTN